MKMVASEGVFCMNLNRTSETPLSVRYSTEPLIQISKKLSISKNTLYKYLRYRNVNISLYKKYIPLIKKYNSNSYTFGTLSAEPLLQNPY